MCAFLGVYIVAGSYLVMKLQNNVKKKNSNILFSNTLQTIHPIIRDYSPNVKK